MHCILPTGKPVNQIRACETFEGVSRRDAEARGYRARRGTVRQERGQQDAGPEVITED